MFDGRAKQYPHLASFLHRLGNARLGRRPGVDVRHALGLLGGYTVLVVAGAMADMALALPGALAYMAALVALSARGSRRPETPETAMMLEAQQTARLMRDCLDKRRLHRELDAASLTLLEECARFAARVQAAFASPFWSRPDLSLHYASVRQQALASTDHAMAEVLMLYRPYLPERVQSRGAMDYVEEALEEYVFKGRSVVSAPAALEPAREIAEKLKTLALEAEEASRLAADDMTLGAQAAPGGGLDISIGELRTIRQAEDELRQNLQG